MRFVLFRADFVRQKHGPGSIETNHGSLSKIIGVFDYSTFFNLIYIYPRSMLASTPIRRETVKARAEKAKHKAMYPLYRFRPVHKETQGDADSTIPPNEDPANKREELGYAHHG